MIFKKYNLKYSWKDLEFITTFTKKYENSKTIYLVCNKRGQTSKICPGKARFIKENSLIEIYCKCKDDKLIHDTIEFETFYENYISNQYT